MTFKPVKTKCFIKFLESKGCKYQRTKASHFHYKCPKCFRTITIREALKDVPGFHIHSNCKTLGIDMKDVYEWIDENC